MVVLYVMNGFHVAVVLNKISYQAEFTVIIVKGWFGIVVVLVFLLLYKFAKYKMEIEVEHSICKTFFLFLAFIFTLF